MSNNDRKNNTDFQKTKGITKLVGLLLVELAGLLSTWIVLTYFHITYFQEYLTIITPTSPPLRVTLIAVLGGAVLSIPIMRGLSRRNRNSQVTFQPLPHQSNPRIHPLFFTPRPSRDTNFVIRKTRNRGRISRNRAGERLPPSYQE